MNLKKALKHDVEVAGKTIPTMILVGLFLVGGGSAAILSSFGTVSGEADVTQAIQIDSSTAEEATPATGQQSLSFGFNSPTAGTTTVDTFTVENNMDRSYPVEFASYTETTSIGDDADETSAQFKWAGSSDSYGIRTTYANYFADAGHDFSDYSVDVEDTSDTVAHVGDDNSGDHEYPDLSSALGEGYDTIYVYEGTYDPVQVDNPVEIVGVSQPGDGDAATIEVTTSDVKQQSGIYVNSEDVTVKGLEFDVNPTLEDGNYVGLKIAQSTDVDEGNVEVESNVFTDGSGDGTALKGVNVAGNSAATVTISNNDFNGLRHAIHLMDGNDVDVENNTFDSQAENGVFVTNNKGHDGLAVDVKNNVFTDIGGFDNSNFDARVDGGAAVHINDEDGDADSSVTVETNRFSGSNLADIGVFNEDGEYSFGKNFFAQGTWEEVNNGNLVGDVTAAYQTVDYIPANSDVEVAAVNEFALMLDGSSYSLATAIQ